MKQEAAEASKQAMADAITSTPFELTFIIAGAILGTIFIYYLIRKLCSTKK